MKLEEIYLKQERANNNLFPPKKPVISFEVFPPKDDVENKNNLIVKELKELSKYNPKLVSVTYGAGGSTKTNSLELTKLIKNEVKIDVMPHFTCKNASKGFIQDYLTEIESESIENVLALRGDIPLNEEILHHDFRYANELVDFIALRTNLSVAVAGYPEGHVESKTLKADIENLKKKVDAGAKVIYTQLFFDNAYFYSYVDLVRSVGINIPIVPGILPITNYNQLSRMISLCHVNVPLSLMDKLDKHKDDSNAVKEIGIDYAIKQSKQLIDAEVKGLHFYILNKCFPTNQILENIL